MKEEERDLVADLFGEFVDRWNAGENPDREEFLGRCPADRREELRNAISLLIRTEMRSAETPEIRVGQRLGNFQIVREIGRGGMGIVYEAEEIQAGRRVALKILSPDLYRSPGAIERFHREARLAATITDPHCVFVYGAFDFGGILAISMELMTGETLEDRIRSGGRVPIETAVQWTSEVLQGLEAAHRMGVLHRDIKPSNCFLTAEGNVKIGDFGLSRRTGPDDRLTLTGSFLGTPLYASPEQVRGREIDFRSDLYSVGLTLYALLAGTPPFGGSNPGEIFAKIFSDDPTPLSSLREDVPVGLEKAILRAIAKNPGKRFASLRKFRVGLQPFGPKSLRFVGLGLRFGALIIDLVILSLLDSLHSVLLAAVGRKELVFDPWNENKLSDLWLWTSFWVPVAILYFGLSEGLYGCTVGKLIVGERVVSVLDGRPSLSRALLRAVIFSVPLVVSFFKGFFYQIDSFLVLATYCLTMRKGNGFRGIHEFLSGTRVVLAEERSIAPDAPRVVSNPPLQDAEPSLPGRVSRYEVKGAIAATTTGPLLLGRDPILRRDVWVHCQQHGAEALDARRRVPRSERRLRWIEGGKETNFAYDVYVDPGGKSFHGWLAERTTIPSPEGLRLLSSLLNELAADPEIVAFEQLWIDRDGRLLILPFHIGDKASIPLSSLALASQAARALCATRRRSAEGFSVSSGFSDLPPDLPLHAERSLRRLLEGPKSFQELREVASDLQASLLKSLSLSPYLRAAQIGICALYIASWALLGGAREQWQVHRGVLLLLEEVESRKQRSSEQGEVSEGEERRLQWISRNLSSQRRRELAEERIREINLFSLEPARGILREARTRFPALGIGPLFPEGDPSAKEWIDSHPEDLLRSITWFLLVQGILSTLLALALRRNLSFVCFGIAIRNRNGDRASRIHCAWRSMLSWIPFVILLSIFCALVEAEGFYGLACRFVIFAALALYGILLVVLSIRNLSQGPLDRLVGTRLVPA